MKSCKIIFFALLVLLLTSCSRKVTFEYYSKDDNTLYLGINNKFYIKSENPNTLDVKITEATIERNNDTTFNIKTDNLRFADMTISNGKKIKKIGFKKSTIPSPELTFRGFRYYDSKTMSVEDARKITQFSSVIRNFHYDLSFISSTLDIIRIDAQKNVMTESVNKEDDRRFRILQIAKAGDTYIFHNIKIEVAKGIVVDGKDLIFTIANE